MKTGQWLIGIGIVGVAVWFLCGCGITVTPAQQQAAADFWASLTNNPPVVTTSPATNPASVTPAVAVDVSGMTRAVPLVPYLGADDAEVNAVLYKRWQDGGTDSCGGLPGDTRPLLVRPSGGTFGWKYIITERESNGPNIILDGDYMTVTSGWYKGQYFKVIGKSDKEWDNGKIPRDFEAIKSGERTLRKHFVSFEAYVNK